MAQKHTKDEYLQRAKKLQANGKDNSAIVKKLLRKANNVK